ncbi:octanoyl-[acyl-carrier-protein]:protein N-octanoyltransferase LIPT2, mitochondrial-like [Babylonia areolata]|uniref:octanoyl-[acyl-carrier-protein]:protein N-octanoyltransferase LIPT2, mitochondrial-like n=1 Tax=Babylonia areolata TaxID=304850 RepID=UPI003FD68FA9
MTSSRRAVQVLHLGRMGYLQAADVQRRYIKQHLQYQRQVVSPMSLTRRWGPQPAAPSSQHVATGGGGGGGSAGEGMGRRSGGVAPLDVLLIVQYGPVFVVDRQADSVDQEERERLKKLGAEVYSTDHQDLITFLGPGQLLAYPVLNPRDFGTCPEELVSILQRTVVSTCCRVGVNDVDSAEGGVWVRGRQIGGVGTHHAHQDLNTTAHGISLNCDVDLSWFRHLRSSQGKEQHVTSLTQELHTPTPVRKVLGQFLAAFQHELRCSVEFSMLDADDVALLMGERDVHASSFGREGEGQGEGGERTWGEEEGRGGSVGGAVGGWGVVGRPRRRRVSMW